MARTPVGDVTLISVRFPAITSMPVNRRPRSFSVGANPIAYFLLSSGELRCFGCSAAHHVGPDIPGLRHAIDGPPRGTPSDQDDPFVPVRNLRQEALADPGLA